MTTPTETPTENHCKDCCCARSWKALGITEYTGKSIPEHIAELTAQVREHGSEIFDLKAQWHEEVTTLTAQLEEARMALKYYADEALYKNPWGAPPRVIHDGGYRALSALAAMQQKEGK